MTLFDSFYMTLITISTVGFSEIAPLTQAGRLITVFIIISGISLLTYTLGQIVQNSYSSHHLNIHLPPYSFLLCCRNFERFKWGAMFSSCFCFPVGTFLQISDRILEDNILFSLCFLSPGPPIVFHLEV